MVNLRGGAFTSQSKLPVPVGFGGGAGVVDVSAGGSFRVAHDLYVGGMATNVVSKFFSNFVEAEQPTADGTVRVADATVAVGGNMILGALGTGTLELDPGAAVTAVDLVLSNQVASCVKVDLGTGDAPAGLVDLSGVLDIAPGARLEIDGSACTGGRTLFPLVRAAGGIRGAFAPENVVCLGRDIGYRVTANGIDAYVTRGTVLLFR